MKAKYIIFLVSIFSSLTSISQTFLGVVLDAKTRTPIESASIYFDNTTIGTTSNIDGEFSISYSDAIKSGLVISYLGYETKTISDYRQKKNQTVYLAPQNNVLDEVVVNTDDGLTRRQKLRLFRKEFLGQSKFGRSCKILNEDALILRYNKKENRLEVDSSAPLKIKNEGLQYLITYELSSFSAKFVHPSPKKNNFEIYSVMFRGNPFYKNMADFNEKKALKNRKKAYLGSTQHFMRSLYADKLKRQKFTLFEKRKKKMPKEAFDITFKDSTAIKKVVPNEKKYTIVYKKNHISGINLLAPYFLLDIFGNYTEVPKIQFSGYMGSKRFGDLLPIDYDIEIKSK